MQITHEVGIVPSEDVNATPRQQFEDVLLGMGSTATLLDLTFKSNTVEGPLYQVTVEVPQSEWEEYKSEWCL